MNMSKTLLHVESASWLDEHAHKISFNFSKTRNLIVAIGAAGGILAFRDFRTGPA
jgi:hypothetical protein